MQLVTKRHSVVISTITDIEIYKLNNLSLKTGEQTSQLWLACKCRDIGKLKDDFELKNKAYFLMRLKGTAQANSYMKLIGQALLRGQERLEL